MDEGLRKALTDRVSKGHRAFAEVERLMAADGAFARQVQEKSATGLPLVLLDWSDAPEPFLRMVAIDVENSRWLVELIASVGWPGVTMVGTEGEAAAWELAMHADTEQEARTGWLALIEVAAERGDAPEEHARFLRMRTEAVAALTE